jgi:hypothetical protein
VKSCPVSALNPGYEAATKRERATQKQEAGLG